MSDRVEELTETPGWPPPIEVLNEAGASDIVLVCEHAANGLPGEYGTLGLPREELGRHIGYDIGAAELTRLLAARLDAPAFFGTMSRLLADLNRPFGVPSSMPVLSEATEIPGNRNLTAAEQERRRRLIFDPFHDRISAFLDARDRAGRSTRLVTMHSFTPVFLGERRAFHAGILFEPPSLYAEAVIEALSREAGLVVGANVPYRIDRAEDYAVPVHGVDRNYPAILVEVRNDFLAEASELARWVDRLAAALTLPLSVEETRDVRR